MWLFYALSAAILWGVGQIFTKKGLVNISPLFNNVYSSFLGLLIFTPFALAHGVQFEKIFQIIPYALIVTTLLLSYYYVIGRGQLALTGTVVGVYPVITVILSLLFLHESPSIYQKMSIGLIILGTAFVALPHKIGKIKLGSWFWWAIFAVFAIGISDFLIKLIINQTDVYTYLFTYGFSSVFINTAVIFFDKKGRKMPSFNWKYYLPTLIGVTMIEIGFFVFHLALAGGYVSLVSPISGIYVAITAVLAWIILKEKISKIQAFGIALSAIGVVLVGIS